MAVKGIGIDIIEINRIKKAIDRWGEAFLNHIYTPEEIAHAARLSSPYAHYAGRFAAKEAIYKALGDAHLAWKDMSILNEESGKPQCYLRGNLNASIFLSISHSRDYAVAQALYHAD